jgi:excisionase family DNA binding protein
MTAQDQLRWHVTRALIEHRRWCRRSGVRMPEALESILDALAAGNGPQRPVSGDRADLVEPDPVSPLLLDDPAVALRLGISERSVRRLRSRGALPSVMVGRRRLMRLSDIENFVENGGAR